MESETIRSWTGQVIGRIETDMRGNKTVRDWSGRLLGTYDASTNAVKDYTGRILYYGNVPGILLRG